MPNEMVRLWGKRAAADLAAAGITTPEQWAEVTEWWRQHDITLYRYSGPRRSLSGMWCGQRIGSASDQPGQCAVSVARKLTVDPWVHDRDKLLADFVATFGPKRPAEQGGQNQ